MNEGEKIVPGQTPVDFEVNPKGVFLADILDENFDVAANKIANGEIVVDADLRHDLEEVAKADTNNPRIKSFITDLLSGNDLSQAE